MAQQSFYRSRAWRVAARAFGLAVLAAIGLGAGPAHAANAEVQVTVTPIPTDVSVKRTGLVTYAAYVVTVQSLTTNVINQAVFSASTAITAPTIAGDAAPYVEAVARSGVAAGCVLGATPNAVRCPIGQLRGIGDPSGSSASFVLIFAAPASGTALALNWQFTYSNGASPGAPPSDIPPPIGGTETTGLITTQSAAQAAGFVSYFPSIGGTFFTAFPQAGVLGGVATLTAPWTTTVVVPTSVVPNTVTVAQGVQLESCSASVTVCYQTDLTIPNQSFNGLTVILRRDASTIKPGAKIATAVIFYRHLPTTPMIQLQACSLTGGPQPGVPCISARNEYSKKNAPTPDFIGDWEFIIQAIDNGRFAG